MGVRDGKGTKICAGRVPTKQDFDAELVDYINDCRKQNLAVTRVVVMQKLIAVKPDAFGGIPSNNSGATERFHRELANWYQRFRRRSKFSTRR